MPNPGATTGHRTLVLPSPRKAPPATDSRESARVSAAPKQPNDQQGRQQCQWSSTGRQADTHGGAWTGSLAPSSPAASSSSSPCRHSPWSLQTCSGWYKNKFPGTTDPSNPDAHPPVPAGTWKVESPVRIPPAPLSPFLRPSLLTGLMLPGTVQQTLFSLPPVTSPWPFMLLPRTILASMAPGTRSEGPSLRPAALLWQTSGPFRTSLLPTATQWPKPAGLPLTCFSNPHPPHLPPHLLSPPLPQSFLWPSHLLPHNVLCREATLSIASLHTAQASSP